METAFRKAIGSDRAFIEDLLKQVKLPVESVGSGATTFYIGSENHSSVAVAGFEFYGNDALLRSVAVRPDLQRSGIGSRFTDWMIGSAKRRGIKRIVLLTETAEKFFAKKGFKVADRSSINNDTMRLSSEFTFACPTSAVCMVLSL